MNPACRQPTDPTDPSPLRCPVCGEAFSSSGRTVRCANNHSFDAAKEGYLNLLLSHQRRSGTPGDDKDMIHARRRFFDSGAFDPLIRRVADLIRERPYTALLDCGCGEGSLCGPLGATDGRAAIFGADISKEAIRCAAKRYRHAGWVVANIMRGLPFADRSMDVILSILAPRNPAEFARILRPGGTLLLGVPGPDHLIELRSQLQHDAGDFGEKADDAAAQCAAQFSETQRDPVCIRRTLSPAQIADLIRMTPLFWNSAPDARARLCRLDRLRVTVSFVLLRLTPADPAE